MTVTTPPALESVMASSDLETAITFGFRGQEAMATVVRYTKLTFAVFAWGYLLVLLGLSSLSFSTGVGNDKDMTALGAAQ